METICGQACCNDSFLAVSKFFGWFSLIVCPRWVLLGALLLPKALRLGIVIFILLVFLTSMSLSLPDNVFVAIGLLVPSPCFTSSCAWPRSFRSLLSSCSKYPNFRNIIALSSSPFKSNLSLYMLDFEYYLR